MIRSIIKDPVILSTVSVPAEPADLSIAEDLQDTLLSHADTCVGMAANMIGENKCIIAVMIGRIPLVLFNHEITR